MTPENIKYIIDSVSNANLQRSVDNFDRRCEKFLEELGELAEARLGYTSKNNPKNKTLDDVKEEAVDVLIVALDISLTPFSFFSSTNEIKNELYEYLEYDASDAGIAFVGSKNTDDSFRWLYNNSIKYTIMYFSDFWRKDKIHGKNRRNDIASIIKKFVSHVFCIVKCTFKFADEQEIIDMVDKKISKWLNGRSTVITIDDEG